MFLIVPCFYYKLNSNGEFSDPSPPLILTLEDRYKAGKIVPLPYAFASASTRSELIIRNTILELLADTVRVHW